VRGVRHPPRRRYAAVITHERVRHAAPRQTQAEPWFLIAVNFKEQEQNWASQSIDEAVWADE
jgi:hypothetical protein